jgi:hypothetical protein
MANTFNTNKDAPGIVAKAAAKMLADELQFCKSIAKADESDYNGKNGYSAGDTIYISKPARFLPQTTFDISSSQQDIVEEKVALTLDTISTVGVNIDTLEFATEIQMKETLRRVVKPAVQAIAQDVESRFLDKAMDATYNVVGTPGSTVFDTDTVLSAREKMNQFLCPKDDQRSLLFNSTAMRSAVNARKGLFQSSDEISKQYKQGFIGMSDGFKWLENELLPTHTNGNDTSFEVRTTVSTEGQSTLVVEGLTTTTGTVTKGTTFTIDTVFAVHPITKTTLPNLQEFVVTADATADGSGYATLSISPALYTSASNGLQNISAFPVDGDTCNVKTGTASTGYTNNLAFHKDAFRMVSAPLVMPTKAEFAVQESYQGISVAIIRDFDVNTRKMITRLDFLGGITADRPEWACRLVA